MARFGVKDGWIVDMSGIAGGKPGTPEQVAEVSEFTHLTEPDGTVYPHLLADALTALALVLGAWRRQRESHRISETIHARRAPHSDRRHRHHARWGQHPFRG